MSNQYALVSGYAHNAKPCFRGVLTNEPGVIPSRVKATSACGSSKSPWIIETKAGQTVEIALLDFKALSRVKSHSLMSCADVYGFIVERTLNINDTICGQNARETIIYRSKTNTLELYVKRATNANFLLKYKGDQS